MKKTKALLVIDMQKGSFTIETPRFNSNEVIRRINELTKIFRKLKLPVIYIQHNGNGTGEFEKHTVQWELLDDLSIEASDICIDKYVNDVFYESKLDATLNELNINELFITGCATDFCVASTIQSAITKDYNITVVSDGHTTGERPHLKAKQVIDHYNWIWENMIPTKGRIAVKAFNEIQKELQ